MITIATQAWQIAEASEFEASGTFDTVYTTALHAYANDALGQMLVLCNDIKAGLESGYIVETLVWFDKMVALEGQFTGTDYATQAFDLVAAARNTLNLYNL